MRLLISQGEAVPASKSSLAGPPMAEAFAMMTMIGLTALLAGALLGLRFKVWILGPAIIFGSAATLGASLAHSTSPLSIVLAVIVSVVALQVGYFAGMAAAGTRTKTISHLAPARAR